MVINNMPMLDTYEPMLETYEPILVINNMPMLETHEPVLVINNIPTSVINIIPMLET